jgi:hypothetical protein
VTTLDAIIYTTVTQCSENRFWHFFLTGSNVVTSMTSSVDHYFESGVSPHEDEVGNEILAVYTAPFRRRNGRFGHLHSVCYNIFTMCVEQTSTNIGQEAISY